MEVKVKFEETRVTHVKDIGTVKVLMLKGEKGDQGESGDYSELQNKPQINGVELTGNKTATNLGLASQTDLESVRNTAVNNAADISTLQEQVTENAGDIDSLETTVGGHGTDISALQATLVNKEDINNGVKNLLPFEATTGTQGGITYTVDRDSGTITATGTATSTHYRPINAEFTLPAGTYILSGCPAGGSTSSYWLRAYVDNGGTTSTYADVGAGREFTLTEECTCAVRIAVRKDAVLDGVVFQPMVRLASITDDTYVQYAKTNAVLTKEIAGMADLQQQITANASGIEKNAEDIAVLGAGKQDKLTFDTEPTGGSTNPVTSGGVYTAINNSIRQMESGDLTTQIPAGGNYADYSVTFPTAFAATPRVMLTPWTTTPTQQNVCIPVLTAASATGFSFRVWRQYGAPTTSAAPSIHWLAVRV